MNAIRKVKGGWRTYSKAFPTAKNILHKTRRDAQLAADVLQLNAEHKLAQAKDRARVAVATTGKTDWQRYARTFARLDVSEVEHATILAALRLWQSNLGPNCLPARARAEQDFGDYFHGMARLDASDIDRLCQRINS